VCSSGTFGPVPEQAEPRRLRYEIVRDMILGIIESEGLQAGDRLPTSAELAEQSGFSLISVRRALDELERAGVVQRQQGVGTFVARGRIVSEPARLGNLLETLEGDGGSRLVTELVSVRVGLPSAGVAANLQVGDGLPVWEVVRRRVLDGRPVIAETALLPLQLVPALDTDALAKGESLYSYLAQTYGLVDEHEDQFLEVVSPPPAVRQRLELGAREQVVRIRGVSYSTDGTPFDCFEQTYPAHEFVFSVSGSARRRLLPDTGLGEWGISALPG
jgi:DNA-binding GntR family transcriptional regulator